MAHALLHALYRILGGVSELYNGVLVDEQRVMTRTAPPRRSAGSPPSTSSTRRAPALRPMAADADELRSSLDPDAHRVMSATVRPGRKESPKALDRPRSFHDDLRIRVVDRGWVEPPTLRLSATHSSAVQRALRGGRATRCATDGRP